MVSYSTLFSIGVTIFLSLVLPIAAAVWLCVMKKISWKPVLCGVIIFSVSQVFIRMPLLSVFQQDSWYMGMANNPWVIGLFLAFTAGLVEEYGRFFGGKYLLKGQLGFRDAVAYGIGHGGIEAVVLVGMNSINNLMVALSINNGSLESISGATPEQIAQIKDIYLNTPWSTFLMGGVERLMTMAIQIGLSVLVFVALRKNSQGIVWAAIALHTAINLPIGALSRYGVMQAEAYILVCAVFCVWLTRYLKKKHFDAARQG